MRAGALRMRAGPCFRRCRRRRAASSPAIVPGPTSRFPCVTGPATAQAPALLEAQEISKRFGERQALRAVSLSAAAGEVVAIIGPNGAGKTTLLSIIAGILKADSGTLSWPAGEIGWVPQHAAVYGKLTVAENLRLFARLERCADVEAAVGRMLAQTDSRSAPATRP